jgi:hypothetical protein
VLKDLFFHEKHGIERVFNAGKPGMKLDTKFSFAVVEFLRLDFSTHPSYDEMT